MDDRKNVTKHEFVISETETSNFNYHLRQMGPEGIKLGVGAGFALCGKKVGWDTQIPLKAYGMKDHLPSKWCDECLRIMNRTIELNLDK